MLPEAVTRFRNEYRRTEVSPRYSGWLHFATTTLGSLAAIALCAWRLHDVTAAQWLTIPIAFLLTNLLEYLGHRGPMHHLDRRFAWVYKRHTGQHHRFYTHDAMELESTRDFKIVLFPAPIVVFFAVPLGLIALAISLVTSANVGWLVIATGFGYFLLYEWLHLSYHLPEDTWVGRLSVVRRLKQLHQQHHDPRLMQRYNFNITFPIFDAIYGTRYRE